MGMEKREDYFYEKQMFACNSLIFKAVVC